MEGSGWFSFVLCSTGIVWLTLPTFYSPVALSMCRSSRGNVMVCSPDPNLPGQASGCSHYPVASQPPTPHPHPPSQNTAPSDPMTAGLAAAAHCSSDCIHALYLHTLASITLIHMWLRNAVWMINMIYIWMSVCLDFKLTSRSPNKCTSHHLHVCGVMVKLNNSHKLCCAHLWHCKPDTFPLIYLKCKDLWCDPFAFCNIVVFFSLCLIYCFISPCIFPAVTLQMFFCLICLCAIILFSSCAASFVFAPLNLFNISIYNMIIVSVVLYIS